MLPYSVVEGDFSLNPTNQEIEIEYHDPDISYRDLLVKVTLLEGEDIQIIYIRCSDEARLELEEGKTATFYHNFAGTILIRLINSSTSANGSYDVIDRASIFIPKSATKACTGMPRLVYGISITTILIVIVAIVSFSYFIVYHLKNLKKIR